MTPSPLPVSLLPPDTFVCTRTHTHEHHSVTSSQKQEIQEMHHRTQRRPTGFTNTRGVQEVRRLTQLIIRHVYVIFCHFSTGPAFLQSSSDSVVKELLILLFEPTIRRADNVSAQNCPFAWESGSRLIFGSLGPPESTPQTESRSVQPFLQCSRV